MIISFFSTGTGGGQAPVEYLIASEVLAYDENRNLIRADDGEPLTKVRDPLPEVLKGNPEQTRVLIDASQNKWSYTAGVISFAQSDAPSEDAQHETIEQFEALAFAGLDADQYDCLWVRHAHEGNVELHFCTPRLELASGKALNIAPPGHEGAFNALRDVLNKSHNWADPLESDRAREFKPVRESAERSNARNAIIGVLYDQIDAGLITDRSSMIGFLEGIGFEVTRKAEKSISVRDPEFSKPFKLEGVLTHERWTAESSSEIAAEYQVGANAERTSRLDAIPHEQLREALKKHVERRAKYNRERFGGDEREDSLHHGKSYQLDAEMDEEPAMGDIGDERGVYTGVSGNQPSSMLADPADADESVGSNHIENRRADLSSFGSTENLDGKLFGRGQGGELSEGREIDGDPNSVRARIALVRRAVGDGLRDLSFGIARFGGSLDERAGEAIGQHGAMRELAHEIATNMRSFIGGIASRGAQLREAKRAITTELETSESRRKTAEEEVNELQLERFRDLDFER